MSKKPQASGADHGRPPARLLHGTTIRLSRQAVALYRELSKSGRSISTTELVARSGVSRELASHILTRWRGAGLVQEIFLGNAAWWSWHPTSAAKDLVTTIEESARLFDELPAPAHTSAVKRAGSDTGAVASLARALATLLIEAADRLDRDK